MAAFVMAGVTFASWAVADPGRQGLPRPHPVAAGPGADRDERRVGARAAVRRRRDQPRRRRPHRARRDALRHGRAHGRRHRHLGRLDRPGGRRALPRRPRRGQLGRRDERRGRRRRAAPGPHGDAALPRGFQPRHGRGGRPRRARRLGQLSRSSRTSSWPSRSRSWSCVRPPARVPAAGRGRATDDDGRAAARGTRCRAWREPRTLLVGVSCWPLAFTEGAANDWLAVAIRDGYDTERGVGVLGFAAFVTAMTVGRVLGTRCSTARPGHGAAGRAFALAGVGALLVILGPAIGLVAARRRGAVGRRAPRSGSRSGMSAAADDPEHAAARVSVVASIGYCAFLAGPPLLGFLGDHSACCPRCWSSSRSPSRRCSWSRPPSRCRGSDADRSEQAATVAD